MPLRFDPGNNVSSQGSNKWKSRVSGEASAKDKGFARHARYRRTLTEKDLLFKRYRKTPSGITRFRTAWHQLTVLRQNSSQAILLRVTCYTASLYVIDFTCALNFCEAQPQRTLNISDGVPEVSSPAVRGNRSKSLFTTFISSLRPQALMISYL